MSSINKIVWQIIYVIKQLIAWLVFWVIKVPFSRKAKGGKNLLFIELGNIGDILIKTNHIVFNKNTFLLVKEEFYDLFRNSDFANQIIKINLGKWKYNLIYKYRFLKYMEKFEFGEVYNLSSARTISVDEVAFFIPAIHKYCFENSYKKLINFNLSWFDKYYDSVFSFNTINEYIKTAQLFKTHFNNHSPNCLASKLILAEATIDKFKLKKSSYLCIAPFTSEEGNDWGPQKTLNFIQLGLTLRYDIVIFGAPGQKIDGIEKLDSKKIINLIGKTRLDQLPSLIKNSKGFVGFDSGLTHLAALLNIPTVCILGGGMFGRFFPIPDISNINYVVLEKECFGCEWRCIYQEKECLIDLEENIVFNKLITVLEGHE